jgi:predicted metalloendopeptidase
MVANVIAAYGQAFQYNDWMGSATKQKALAKLATFNPKIGYPKKWRDYHRQTLLCLSDGSMLDAEI